MFSAKVREKLRYYVYLYVDPRTDTVFYVGKGRGNRAFSHLRDRSESGKVEVIEELDKLGKEPRIEILRYGMSPQELYDATRSCWKVGGKRKRAQYVMAVYQRVVREV